MTIFYFDVNDGQHTRRDSAGADLGNIDEAKASAIAHARHLLAHLTQAQIAAHTFEIRDQSGAVVARIPFSDGK